ncbi:FecR family protein [Chitinophaga filiformis]|uniref:FecR domain-containing protein n=1 Tax=Chitinophaga filiformis TaxID=104663 RepID=A0ABY4I4Y6_CHIFI|nr:FecR domain-containing protein [Chitinophaga filiformis]UPK71134.1 FecR domain-containing protein [Chitinophaga filiformis]
MIQIPEHIAFIIIKHLRAIQTSAEEETLQAWIAGSEEHKKAYQQMVSLWKESGQVLGQPAFDTARAWEKLDSSLHHGTSAKSARIRYMRLALAACVVGVLALAGWMFYQQQDKTVLKIAAAGKGSQRVTLPDGSLVILREGASIRYPKAFDPKERAVTVTGESYFDVQQETGHPFRIQTARATIEVLGTSFTITSNAHQDRLVVVSGKVLFSGKDQHAGQHVVTAQQDAVLNEKGINIVPVRDSNYLSWQTGILQFDNTPFADVVITLADYYNLHIKADSVLTRQPGLSTITARFEHQPLDQVLEEIKLLINVNYRKQNDTIIFYQSQ